MCTTNESGMVLLVLLEHNRFNFGLQQSRCQRSTFVEVEALYQRMLYINSEQCPGFKLRTNLYTFHDLLVSSVNMLTYRVCSIC